MSQFVETACRADTAAGAVAQYLRVKTPGAIAAAGATDVAFGTMELPCLAAGPCTVRLRTAQGTRKMVASEAITAGNPVYAAASGKIAASGTVYEGVALEAATANNDVIEVCGMPNVDITATIVSTNGVQFEVDADSTAPKIGLIGDADGTGNFTTWLTPEATLSADNTIIVPEADGDTLAAVALAQTLTNKTLTAPVIQVIAMTGTTGSQEIRLTTNLADALSIEDTAGDLIVFTTTTGSQLVTITPATTVTGLITANGGVTLSGAVDLTFSGTTGQPEIVVPDNLADALSIKDAGGGADILVITTTNSAELVAFNVPIRPKTTTTPVAAAGSSVADAGQLSRSNVVHITSDGATKGVKLATGVDGDRCTIINDSGTAAELYAAAGGTVNGLAADASVVIPASKGVECYCTGADTWIVFDMAAKASAS